MTYLEHDLGPEGPTRTPNPPVTTQRIPTDSRSGPVLDLQRLAGNAAVSQAIKTGRLDGGLPVQRLDDEEETGEEEGAQEAGGEEAVEEEGGEEEAEE